MQLLRRMSIYLWFISVCGVLACFLMSPLHVTAAVTTPPNIIFIFADDMGYGDVSLLNPGSKISTPNIDKLGRSGMYFTDAHAACSVCGPSRYAVMTGRYPMRNVRKSSNLSNGYGPRVIEPDRLTVAQLLKNKGYDTTVLGKWHLGMTWYTKDGSPLENYDAEKEWDRIDYARPLTDGPNSVGFDHFFGIGASLDMVPYIFIENTGPTEIPTVLKQNDPPRLGPAGEKFEPIDVLPTLTTKSLELIAEHGPTGARFGTPFFLYMPLNGPHTPLVPTADFQGKNTLGPYGDFCMQVDDTVGQIMNALEKHQLRENTLVIFTSDNGFATYLKPEKYEAQGHFSRYQFRGYKGDIFDGGHRMPFLVSWPRQVKPGGVCNELVSLTDFFATCADITGFQVPDTAGEDSISFLPLLQGKDNSAKRTEVVHLSPRNSVSLRQGAMKLIVPSNTGAGNSIPNPANTPAVQLYNMASDIGETTNLATAQPETVKTMRTRLQSIFDSGRSTPGTPQKNDSNLRLL